MRGDLPAAQLALVFTGLGQLALAQRWASGGAWPRWEEIPERVVTLFLDGALARPKKKGR